MYFKKYYTLAPKIVYNTKLTTVLIKLSNYTFYIL